MASNSPPPDPNCSTQCPLAGNPIPVKRQKRSLSRALDKLLVQGVLLLVTGAALLEMSGWRYGALNIFEPEWKQAKPAPLAMKGGDPYIRALMRTISASESNVPKPYSVIYGGEHFRGWDRHPDRCITIPVGPNTGDCSTAAGRYQFITTTWEAQAEKYHPEQPGILFWRPHPFDPNSQDRVVHDWLNDSGEWGTDLGVLLREGEIGTVLEILSPTWTSLGYGIETNSMSSYLPEIYFEMLDEELAGAETVPTASPTDPPTDLPQDPDSPERPPEAAVPTETAAPLVTQAGATALQGSESSSSGSSSSGSSSSESSSSEGPAITAEDEQERQVAIEEKSPAEKSPAEKSLDTKQPFLLPPGEVLRRLGQELEMLL